MGFAFGYWLSGWVMALIMAGVGLTLASFRKTWISISAGACCGLFVAPIYHPNLIGPVGPIAFGMLGALLGSFLSDCWQFTSTAASEAPPDTELPSSLDDRAETR